MFKKMNGNMFWVISALILGLFLAIPGFAVGAEVKPGDVINSSNIDQYESYFPMFMKRYVKDGWGFEKPVVIKVREREHVPLTKEYEKASIANQKTCKLTSEGLLEGYSGQGMPFYDPKEPNLAIKCMWNQFYKPYPDSWLIPTSYLNVQKRKGAPRPSISDNTYEQVLFSNRTMKEPVPEMANPKQLYYSSKLSSQTPPNKDMITLTWRYKDPLKYDDMWTYVPTLRRTLRLVSSERANPIRGSPYTWDDIFGFDGKIPLFTYEFVGEQTVLCLNNGTLKAETVDRKNYPWHPVTHDNEEFETTDTWVIDITAKDPRYPQSKKTAWIDKNRYWCIYAQMYDKKGDFWKGFWNASQSRPLISPYGEEAYRIQCGSGISDFKTFFWVVTVTGELEMNIGPDPSLFQPGALGTF
jgi:hypothetical protein